MSKPISRHELSRRLLQVSDILTKLVIELSEAETDDTDYGFDSNGIEPDYKPVLDQAIAFLNEYDGEIDTLDIFEEAKKQGIKKNTLYFVRDQLKIPAVKREDKWYWVMGKTKDISFTEQLASDTRFISRTSQ